MFVKVLFYGVELSLYHSIPSLLHNLKIV